MRAIDGDELIVAIERMMKHQIDADDICEMIQNFPTIEPERKTGKWEPVIDANENGEPYQSGVYCSECGHIEQHETCFCSSCGSDMREENDCEDD